MPVQPVPVVSQATLALTVHVSHRRKTRWCMDIAGYVTGRMLIQHAVKNKGKLVTWACTANRTTT
jgi:hypothetical protein